MLLAVWVIILVFVSDFSWVNWDFARQKVMLLLLPVVFWFLLGVMNSFMRKPVHAASLADDSQRKKYPITVLSLSIEKIF